MEQTSIKQEYSTGKRLFWGTGRFYIPFCVFLAELVLVPGLFVWVALLSINAEFSAAQIATMTPVLTGLSLISILVLATILHLSSREASACFGRLNANEILDPGSIDEAKAWKQISAAPWRLGYLSFLIFPVTLLLPFMGYLRSSFSANSDQLFYAFLGGLVATLGTILLSVLMLERFLISGREALVPKRFEAQLAGAAGFRMRGKFVSAIVILIVICVLLLVPIGYHISYVILYEPLGSEQVFEQLRTQSLVASIVVIALGLISALLITGSIAAPVRNLVEAFGDVEEGNLHQRASVRASDEVGELTVYFNRMISRLDELQTSLEMQVNERTSQLEATIEVGRVASSILDPEELIQKVTQLISDRFGYYYAAIFLIDESGAWAELKQATGEAGKLLMERRHRLPIGGKSMVSNAIQTRRGKIALDVGKEATRFNNPLLPLTRSEIALPLITASRTLGVLDVQSIQPAAFNDNDISTLQSMANQVAIALENARLFHETESALHEIRTAESQVFKRAWSDLAGEEKALTYETGSGEGMEGEVTSMEIPLLLRDQKLGSITVEGTSGWTAEEKTLLEALAAQTSLALENARLINESQQAALRERLASAIIERIWSSPSVEAILQTAVRELGQALDATEASIELKVEDQHE